MYGESGRRGVALQTLWGYESATADIDFMARLDRENRERLAAALAEWNARRRRVDADTLGIDPTDPEVLENGASFMMEADAGPLDFLNDVPGAGNYDTLRSRALKADAGGVAVWEVGFDDLIRMKEASGRAQDLLDIQKLREARSPSGE